MADRIYLCLAHMSGEEMKYIQEAFDTNWVVPLGPNVNGFEEDLRKFVAYPKPLPEEMGVQIASPVNDKFTDNVEGALRQIKSATVKLPSLEERALDGLSNKQVVALSSGTAAVHLALIDLGVGLDDEVICQSFTFCASCNPIKYLGATPVLVDSEADTWNMDPVLLEDAINDRIAQTGKKPKAIIPVYLYGMPAKIDEIMEVASRYDIPVIEDAAEGLGSRYRGQTCGTFGQYGVLSFNGNKMITTSGGGALICQSEETKKRIMFYATQAREAYPYYQHEQVGYNYRMSNICAGIGRGQMTVLNDHVAHHRHVASLYREAFAGVDGITFHDELPGMESNFWLSTILLDDHLRVKGDDEAYSETVTGAVGGAAGVVRAASSLHTDCEPNKNVEAMRKALDIAGIEARPLWKPMHKQPVYRDVPQYVNGTSEKLFRKGLCLPSGPYVSDEDVQRIVAEILNSLA